MPGFFARALEMQADGEDCAVAALERLGIWR